MPIGKDSIQKRVAKVETAAVETAAVETVAETAPAAEKPAAKKATTTKKCATTAAKKPAAKKPTAEKPVAPVVDNEPATAVLSNVAPETVAAVIGHEEGTPSDRVSIGDKMPTYLL